MQGAYFYATNEAMKKGLTYSTRKHIRGEKSRIRALFSDTKEAEEKIRELVKKIRDDWASKSKI